MHAHLCGFHIILLFSFVQHTHLYTTNTADAFTQNNSQLWLILLFFYFSVLVDTGYL